MASKDGSAGFDKALKVSRPSPFSKARLFRLKSQKDGGRFVFKNNKAFFFALLFSIMETYSYQRGFLINRKYLGAAFMIPYIMIFLVLGLPLLLSQIFLGQYARVGLIKLWRLSPFGSGIGFSMIIVCLIKVIGKCRLCSMALLNVILSMRPQLEWANCDFVTDGQVCVFNATHDSVTQIAVDKKCCKSVLDEFKNCEEKDRMFLQFSVSVWNKKHYYDISHSIEDGLGDIYSNLAITVAGVWCIIFVIVYQGMHFLNKVIIFLGAAFIIVVTSLVLIVFFGGAGNSREGIRFFFEMKPQAFIKEQLWIESMDRAIESLHLISGAFVIFSSFAPKKSNAISITVMVGSIKVALKLFVMLMFMAIGGSVAKHLNVPYTCMYTSGWESTHATPAQFFSQIDNPHIPTVLYYLLLFFMDLSHMVLLLLVVLESVLDVRPKLREYYLYMVLAVCLFGAMCGLLLTTKGATYVNGNLQKVVFSAGSVVLACYAIVVFWIYGVVRLSDDIFFCLGKPPSKFWTYMWYLVPAPLVVVSLPKAYNDMMKINDRGSQTLLPFYFTVFALIVSPILIAAVYQCTYYFKAARFSGAFTPTREWGLVDKEERKRRLHFNPRKIVRFRIDAPLKHRPAGLISKKYLKMENDRLDAHRKIFLEYYKAKEEQADLGRGRGAPVDRVATQPLVAISETSIPSL